MDEAEVQYWQKRERIQWETQQGWKIYGWLGGEYRDPALASKTFATFDAVRQLEGYQAAKLFAEVLTGTLILYGPYGTGKTHLLAAICNTLRARQIGARFVTAPYLFHAISGHMTDKLDFTHILREAKQAPLLAIDDIDKAGPSPWREEIYHAILDYRANNHLPTAISTNRLSELGTFVGGAVKSRLSIGQVAIKMDGADYRLKLV